MNVEEFEIEQVQSAKNYKISTNNLVYITNLAFKSKLSTTGTSHADPNKSCMWVAQEFQGSIWTKLVSVKKKLKLKI
jgi:hypothetical protein